MCLLLGATTLLILAVPASWATKIEVSLTIADITIQEASVSGLGDYYTLRLDVPDVVTARNFYGATLVLYVDAASSDESEESGPLFEVYALRSPFSGSVNASQFVFPSATVTHVAAGSSQKVLFDVSEIVERYLKDPGSNHGLIMGSLTGARTGLFTVKDNVVGPNVVAKVNFHYDGRVYE
jgi:hypothetical protein